MEPFYVFRWAGNRGGRNPKRHANRDGDDKPRGKGKPQGRKGGPKKGGKPQGAQKYSARPPKSDKPIDPDNPFAAALMGLKTDK
jgi:ATP-dependent RNA helicase SUPV3L1/SUV3